MLPVAKGQYCVFCYQSLKCSRCYLSFHKPLLLELNSWGPVKHLSGWLKALAALPETQSLIATTHIMAHTWLELQSKRHQCPLQTHMGTLCMCGTDMRSGKHTYI